MNDDPKSSEPTLDDAQGTDPVEFLRAALKISAEDAAKVREDAAEAMRGDGDPSD